MMKLNLGCGGDHLKGYIHVDLYCPQADIKHDLTKPLPFEDESIDEIWASHIIEHLSLKEWEFAKKDWARVLKNGGKLEIHCPELEHCVFNFLRNHRDKKWDYWIKTIYGGQNGPGEYHKNGFTYEKLEEDLVELFTSFSRIEEDETEIHLICIK